MLIAGVNLGVGVNPTCGNFIPGKIPLNYNGILNWERADFGIIGGTGLNINNWTDQHTSNNQNYSSIALNTNCPNIGNDSYGRNYLNFGGSSVLTTSILIPLGAKTICYVFQLTSLPGVGAFYSFGQLVSNSTTASEILLINSAGYQTLSF